MNALFTPEDITLMFQIGLALLSGALAVFCAESLNIMRRRYPARVRIRARRPRR